jgi:hypothetical protein
MGDGKITRIRNFLAHGVVLGDPGNQLLWSHRRLKHIKLNDAVAAKPWFVYANVIIMFITWRLLEMDPCMPLPHRPA